MKDKNEARKVTVEELHTKFEMVEKAAKEGRLFIKAPERRKLTRNEVKMNVRAYIGQIKHLAAEEYINQLDELWDDILREDSLVDMFMPGKKARKCHEFNKYGVMRIVGIMRNGGVYKQHITDTQLCEALEQSKGDNSYRSYLGKGIDDERLRLRVRDMLINMKKGKFVL